MSREVTPEANKVAVDLTFGALVPCLHEQLASHGITYGVAAMNAVDHFQLDADAIVRLNVRGLLPDSQARALRTKLFRRIVEMVGDLRVARVNAAAKSRTR